MCLLQTCSLFKGVLVAGAEVLVDYGFKVADDKSLSASATIGTYRDGVRITVLRHPQIKLATLLSINTPRIDTVVAFLSNF